MDAHERQFDRELGEIKKKLLHMAAVVEAMTDRAIQELVTRDESPAAAILQQEQELNRLQIEIDDDVVTLLATHQPVAGDLRYLLAATRITNDLERIGDLVVNITENVHVLIQQPPVKPLEDIPRMAELVRKRVRDGLHAFVRGDVLAAQAVIVTDDEVDDLKDKVQRELVEHMKGDPQVIERSLMLVLIARHLERIGDHATNIAEDVIYQVQGQDVRHPRTPRQAN